MIVLYEVNSRFKDFYDVYQLVQTQSFEALILQEAMSRTFERRHTPLDGILRLFDPSFKGNTERQRQWRVFLNRIQTDEAPSFEEVIMLLELFLKPIARGTAQGVWQPIERIWLP